MKNLLLPLTDKNICSSTTTTWKERYGALKTSSYNFITNIWTKVTSLFQKRITDDNNIDNQADNSELETINKL